MGSQESTNKFLKVIRNLSFKEQPDYHKLKRLLRNIISKIQIKKGDQKLDWIEKSNEIPKPFGFKKEKSKIIRSHSCNRKLIKTEL